VVESRYASGSNVTYALRSPTRECARGVYCWMIGVMLVTMAS